MRRFWPFGLIILGIAVIFVGFVYDVLFAGIPYQDPTPAMTASYNFHAGVASIIRWSGVSVCLLGGVIWIVRRIARRRQK